MISNSNIAIKINVCMLSLLNITYKTPQKFIFIQTKSTPGNLQIFFQIPTLQD